MIALFKHDVWALEKSERWQLNGQPMSFQSSTGLYVVRIRKCLARPGLQRLTQEAA